LPFLAVQLGGRSKCEDDVAAWWNQEYKVDANAGIPQDPSGPLRKLIEQGCSSLAIGRFVVVYYTAKFIHQCPPD
jgi:hypothetical protein